MALITSRFLREGRGLPDHLEAARAEIEAIARGYGLDFFDTIFEMCTYDEINMLASYGGFPVRYPHWRWGMEYLSMEKGYEYGLQKIYEMVINTDPSYAYLLDNNLDVDQKLVMAHVYGHVDFFKNNQWFQHTNRRMLDEMANHATKIRGFMGRHGQSEVEAFIDIGLSIENLIDVYSLHIKRTRPKGDVDVLEQQKRELTAKKLPASEYMDQHINPKDVLAAEVEAKRAALEQRITGFPEHPERDVLGFLIKYAPLSSWQRKTLSILREEAYYFAPQGQTKIMNEGWASYWHTTIMTRHVLTDAEVIDFADHHSGTTAMAPGQLNPYKMGLELYRHIEERWNKGRFGKDWLDCDDPRERDAWDTGAGLGREKIFEVRRDHNDITFLDAFLTPEFCAEQGFFTTKYDRRSRKWVIDSREFEKVKKQLLEMVHSRGTPRIQVLAGNHANRGELVLQHLHDGMDLQMQWAATTLGNIAKLWTRPVHLETELDGKPILLTHDGSEVSQSAREAS